MFSRRTRICDRSALFDVFDATYAAADHDHLDRQLDSFGSIAVATERGTIVGFYVADVRSIDLPPIGAHICGRAGLACVVPEARRSGVMVSLAGAAWPHSAVTAGHGGFSLMASRMATPASLNAGLGAIRRGAWPTLDAPFALFDHLTPTQGVDRERGDTLLWINWLIPPPQAWFT